MKKLIGFGLDHYKFLLLFLLLLIVMQSPVVSQRTSSLWKLGTFVQGVKCYYRLANCGGNTVVFLKFNNLNQSKAVTVKWKETFVVTRKHVTRAEGTSDSKEIVLNSGITLRQNCDDTRYIGLLTRPAKIMPVSSGVIKDFSFKDVSVTIK